MMMTTSPLIEARVATASAVCRVPDKYPPLNPAAAQRATPIALLLPDLQGGGVQKVVLTVASALAKRGYSATLVLHNAKGPLRNQLPDNVRLIVLKASPTWLARIYALAADPAGFKELLRPVILPWKPPKSLRYLPDLARYLRRERPVALFTATHYLNIAAILARRLAAVPMRVVLSEHMHLSRWGTASTDWRRRYLTPLLRRVYGEADALVAVSNGVADDLASYIGISRELITTIYNPAVYPDLQAQAQEPLEHPWFAPGAPPVVLGVGRPGRQKDFPTLLRAFARVRAQRPVRLMILGEVSNSDKSTKRRANLMTLTAELGVADDVALPGFVQNPFAYMARASVFVLSSLYEGFANVLVEALACGCPVVSTDCPSGPAEILNNGQFGLLVPVGDDVVMARAICTTLDNPPAKEQLRARAALFSSDRIINRYEEVLFGNQRQSSAL
jgi:glycosyltransferase involved in cell wall biosynthesis